MIAFLHLTRPVNLLIIALTMVVMREGVIAGNLVRDIGLLMNEVNVEANGAMAQLPDDLGPRMPLLHFILLVLSTVLVAAAGNVINDYFDTRIDRVNKPGEVIVGRSVKRRVAMTGHLVLSGLGLVLGCFVAWRSGLLHLALIPAFAIGALWTYSTTFKRRLLIGNGLVATLSALVPLTVGLYEIPLLQRALDGPLSIPMADGNELVIMPAYEGLWYWISGYTAFAFLSTLVRELQKDMADVKGDAAEGCRTVPIVWGMGWARTLTLLYIGAMVAGLLFLRMSVLNDRTSYWYIGIGIIAPLLLSAGFTFQARTRDAHVRAGQVMKVAMVMAVAYAALIRYL